MCSLQVSLIDNSAHEDGILVEYRRKQKKDSHIASFAANGQLFENIIVAFPYCKVLSLFLTPEEPVANL